MIDLVVWAVNGFVSVDLCDEVFDLGRIADL